MIAYIKTQGSKITREGRHLLVKKGSSTHNTLFPYKLDQLVLFGNVELSHQAIVFLLKHEIDTVFLTKSGRYLGRLELPEGKNVFLHQKQYQMLDDLPFVLKAAKAITAGKMANMTTVLMRIKRTKKAAVAGVAAGNIRALLPSLAEAASVSSVRGYEGKASALYFSAFGAGLMGDWTFTKRVRRPPTDPVNSVLSLLYCFLMNRMYAAVRLAGLDPHPGFLHTLDYGRYSLVLDLMEEFRTIIVDTLALSLLNLKILQKQDFTVEKQPAVEDEPERSVLPNVCSDPIGWISCPGTLHIESDVSVETRQAAEPSEAAEVQVGYPVILTPEGLAKVVHGFEKKLTTTFYHDASEKEITYEEAMFYQATQMRRVIEGEIADYQPLLLK